MYPISPIDALTLNCLEREATGDFLAARRLMPERPFREARDGAESDIVVMAEDRRVEMRGYRMIASLADAEVACWRNGSPC